MSSGGLDDYCPPVENSGESHRSPSNVSSGTGSPISTQTRGAVAAVEAPKSPVVIDDDCPPVNHGYRDDVEGDFPPTLESPVLTPYGGGEPCQSPPYPPVSEPIVEGHEESSRPVLGSLESSMEGVVRPCRVRSEIRRRTPDSSESPTEGSKGEASMERVVRPCRVSSEIRRRTPDSSESPRKGSKGEASVPTRRRKTYVAPRRGRNDGEALEKGEIPVSHRRKRRCDRRESLDASYHRYSFHLGTRPLATGRRRRGAQAPGRSRPIQVREQRNLPAFERKTSRKRGPDGDGSSGPARKRRAPLNVHVPRSNETWKRGPRESALERRAPLNVRGPRGNETRKRGPRESALERRAPLNVRGPRGNETPKRGPSGPSRKRGGDPQQIAQSDRRQKPRLETPSAPIEGPVSRNNQRGRFRGRRSRRSRGGRSQPKQ